MAPNKSVTAKFEWGAAVSVMNNAPEKFHFIEIGSVAGTRTIETAEAAEEFGSPLGSKIHLIEAPDGQAIEIPEAFLEPL